jgi:hypothetical protein
MPAKMISEMPLPMPREVICSPSHIRNMVPPVSVITVDAEEPAGIGDDAPLPFEADGDAIGLHGASSTVQIAGVLVDLLAALLAFLLQRFQRGNTVVISCMMIEAEM